MGSTGTRRVPRLEPRRPAMAKKSAAKAASTRKTTTRKPEAAAAAAPDPEQGGLSAAGLNTTGLNIEPPKKGG